jgi:DNA-binding NarL/FixJ family response regulator
VISVVVVDDQELVRAGLARILEGEPDLHVVGQAADGQSALEVARSVRPDVVLMDIRMPRLDGIAATRELVADAQPVRVVMLTTFDLDEYVYESLRVGASGFVLKDAPADEIVRAVRAASVGDALVSPAITRRLITEFSRRRPRSGASLVDSLTEREREVLVLMARGQNNKEIGRSMHISEGTVRTHVGHVLAKLQARDRVQAVVMAYECGFVEPGEVG